VNQCYGKSGTLREGRHRGCRVSGDRYLLAGMRYIELNPVRAGMVLHPAGYAWSSYQTNAMGKACGMLKPHEFYLSLGATPPVRRLAYRELFWQALDPALVHAVRATVQTGTPQCNDRFREQIEQTLQCSAGHPRRGRPVKTDKGTDPFMPGYTSSTQTLTIYFPPFF
jgi:putative transposase